MKTRDLLFQLRDAEITAAIQALEQRTSGELRVLVTGQPVADALSAAWEAFSRLGMDRTSQRHGVLIFVAPEAQKFALLPDEGYADKTPPGWWQEQADQVHRGFQTGDYTGTVVQVIAAIADLMARCFPRGPEDENELPDEVVRE